MRRDRDGRRFLRPSFHLYLLVSTLVIFFAQIPLGVFAAQSPLDTTAHVLLPAAASSLLHDLIFRRVVHVPVEYFCTMVFFGMGAEAVWEVAEFAGDAAFGLSWQVDNADTMNDIMCGIAGAILGAAIRLYLWKRVHPGRRHSSLHRRRRPARPTAARTGRVRPLPPVRPSSVQRAVRPDPGRRSRVGRKIGLVGAAVVVALATPGYAGYLVWVASVATSAATAAPAPPSPSIVAAGLLPAAAADPEPGLVEPIAASVPVPFLGAVIAVGPTPGFVVVAPRGRQAYVANRAAGVVTVVDTAVDRVTATIPVPLGPPQYLAFSPDGRTVYVSIWDEARTVAAIGVLDTLTNSVVTAIPMRSRPFLAAVSPDGRRLYVPNHDSGTIEVVDTATRAVTAEIRVAPDPHWVEFSPDGRQAYTADHESNLVSVIDTATDTVVAEVPVQRSPHSVAVHPTRPLVAGVNYDSDSLSMIDTDSERVVAAVPVGAGPQDVTWAPDGRFAYVANVDADTVSVIDAATMTVTATVPTGDAPTSVAVLPDGRRAYVTNLHDGTLTVLNLAA